MRKGLYVSFLFLLFLFVILHKNLWNREGNREHSSILQEDVDPVKKRLNRWKGCYLNLSWGLPKFYFVHLKDMTSGESTAIRIWDTDDKNMLSGTCEDEIKTKLIDKGIAEYWKGPYMICPPTGTRYINGRPMAVVDPWGRRYRMFYFSAESPENPELWTETEKKIFTPEETWAMVIISGGEDGILQSCASDKSCPSSVVSTAPSVEDTTSEDFKNFDPFHQNIKEVDPFLVIKKSELEEIRKKQIELFKERYPDKKIN
jgi:hypothetical protein